MYEGKIPFDQHGRPVPYVVGHIDKYNWRPNWRFEAHLQFQRIERGRSAAHAVYADSYDLSWEAQMFLSDLTDVICQGLAPVSLHGTFEYVKRGQNYGIKLIDIA